MKRFIIVALNVQSQGAAAQLTKHKIYQRSFEFDLGCVKKLLSRKVRFSYLLQQHVHFWTFAAANS